MEPMNTPTLREAAMAALFKEATTMIAAVRSHNGGLKGTLTHADDLEEALRAALTAPSVPAEACSELPLAITSAPRRIWLDLGFNPWEEDAHFPNLCEVTWSDDNATGDGIEYVRADLAPPAQADSAPPSAAQAEGASWREKAEQEAHLRAACRESPTVAALTAAPAKVEPVATLHDDGSFTWKRDKFRRIYDRQRVGWRMDVFAAPTPHQQAGQAKCSCPIPGRFNAGARQLVVNQQALTTTL